MVWPENWQAVQMLGLLQWQWLSGMQTARIGVDQQSLRALLNEHPDTPQDKSARWVLFEDLLVAGAHCCATWRGKQD